MTFNLAVQRDNNDNNYNYNNNNNNINFALSEKWKELKTTY